MQIFVGKLIDVPADEQDFDIGAPLFHRSCEGDAIKASWQANVGDQQVDLQFGEKLQRRVRVGGGQDIIAAATQGFGLSVSDAVVVLYHENDQAGPNDASARSHGLLFPNATFGFT
jgi:hypothetical protein